MTRVSGSCGDTKSRGLERIRVPLNIPPLIHGTFVVSFVSALLHNWRHHLYFAEEQEDDSDFQPFAIKKEPCEGATSHSFINIWNWVFLFFYTRVSKTSIVSARCVAKTTHVPIQVSSHRTV